VACYGLINDGLRILIPILFQEVWDIIFSDVGTRKYIFLVFVFFQDFYQVVSGTGTGKNLPLPDDDILLKVIGSLLRNTEIFHVGRNLHFAFCTKLKKMIHSVSASKYNSRMVKNIN